MSKLGLEEARVIKLVKL